LSQVYGRDGQFDAEKLIDLLQALEKFSAVRNDGDGTAFKVNGVRGTRIVGKAGDFSGSQIVDTSERDTDIDGGRFRVSRVTNGLPMLTGRGSNNNKDGNDETSTREALRFFFGPEGEVFREFMMEEVVTVVDASSRSALQELVGRIGLGGVPVPSLLRALSPKLSEEDRRVSSRRGLFANIVLCAQDPD
jgi:aarF domain-containing kinase